MIAAQARQERRVGLACLSCFLRFYLLLVGGAIGGGVLSAIVLNVFGDWIDRIDTLTFLGMLYLSGAILFTIGWITVKLLTWFNILKKGNKSGNNANEKDDAYNLV